MASTPSGQPSIEVRVIGPAWGNDLNGYLFVDDQPVGVLSARRAHSFPVESGDRRVSARVGAVRSGTLNVSLAPGERVSLECGYRRGLTVPLIGTLVASAGVLSSLSLGRRGAGVMMQFLGALVFFSSAELLVTFKIPGSRFYLRRSDAPLVGGTKAVAATGMLGLRMNLRSLLLLIACCAPLLWVAREAWDRRPANQEARALRLILSEDPGDRSSGASELVDLLSNRALTPKQVDEAIPGLLVALRDRDSGARESAARALYFMVTESTPPSAAVPRVQAVAAGLAEGLVDAMPKVREHSALALASIYAMRSEPGNPVPALPAESERLFNVLVETVVKDPGSRTGSWAALALGAIAPRLNRAAPDRLLSLLHAADASTRAGAVRLVARFRVGVDSSLPALLDLLEHDPDPKVRRECAEDLWVLRPSAISLPLLEAALRSHEQPVRFAAADLISRIGPPASGAVPSLLPLLQESFEPSTLLEQKYPEMSDPAVAAARALESIAPGTDMAELARASLKEMLHRPGHPWRRDPVERALERLAPAPAGGPASSHSP